MAKYILCQGPIQPATGSRMGQPLWGLIAGGAGVSGEGCCTRQCNSTIGLITTLVVVVCGGGGVGDGGGEDDTKWS